jgi:hypothetical protein
VARRHCDKLAAKPSQGKDGMIFGNYGDSALNQHDVINMMSRSSHDTAWPVSPASSFPAIIRIMSRSGATAGRTLSATANS